MIFTGHEQPKLRVLCLHGKGTNASILQSQMRSFSKSLESEVEFVFVDGILPSDPYPGADRFFQGPFYSWYEAKDVESRMAAEEHILELARPDALGPFDGIAGFSQGGALAASISARYCGQDVVDSPFRFAIFLCTGLPIGFEETLEVEEERQPWIRSYPNVSQARKRMNTNRPKLWSNLSSSSFQSSSSSSSEESSDDSASSSPISSPILRPSWVSSVREDSGYFGQLPGPPYKEEAKGNWGRGSDAFRRNQVNLQSKHQRSHGLIRIPTVHVIGARDSIASRSSELYEACDGRSRTIYRHDSGHSLPRTSVVTAGIQRAIREVIDIVRTS